MSGVREKGLNVYADIAFAERTNHNWALRNLLTPYFKRILLPFLKQSSSGVGPTKIFVIIRKRKK